MSVSLPQLPVNPTTECPTAPTAVRTRPHRKTVKLSELAAGETARVVRVATADAGCRKRFAELGLAEGMKVKVVGTGDTLMLALGGCKMGLACRCADEITVIRV